MSFFSQEFSSASNMELDQQTQPQHRDSSTSQSAQCTTTRKRESQESVFHANVPSNGDRCLTDTKNVKEETINEDLVDLVDQEFFDRLPPGYRFNPTDVELILHYLKPKTENTPLPRNLIRHVNLYQYTPDEITVRYKELTDSEWYFFTPRDRKYKNGNRPNRAAGTGYWKATGADKSIIYNGDEIGFRKALVFYEGKPPKGEKTSWIMHEYRVKEETPKRTRNGVSPMRLDDYILCRIYKKSDKLFKSRQRGEIQNQDLQDDIQDDEELRTSKNDGFCTVKDELNAYGDQMQYSHVMDVSVSPHSPHSFHSQQPAMNKRVRPIHFAPPTSFGPPLVYPADNMSGYFKDENIWNLPENQLGLKTQEFSEFDFPDIKYDVALPELDNILSSMYPPIDDLSMPSLDNPSLPKRN